MSPTMSTDVPTAVPTAREVRREIRDWRRGRAELKWGEVLSDAYIALFCVLMVGAMGGNVVLSLRRLADDSCVTTCADTRSAAPWMAADRSSAERWYEHEQETSSPSRSMRLSAS